MAWMRNKPDADARPTPAHRQPEQTAPPQTNAAPAAREIRGMDKLVNIGQSVEIKGELRGNEDLTIEGKVDGTITLRDHALTVGANGKIQGEIIAKSVIVVGQVNGNISADDKVEVASTGAMKGDIVAPRVVLADGARFKGTIDMDSKKAPTVSSSASNQAPAASKPAAMAGAGAKT